MAVDLPPSSGSHLTPESLYDDCSDGLIVVSILFISINISVVVFRIISRHLSRTALGQDDFMAILALFFCLAICAMGIGKVLVTHSFKRAPLICILVMVKAAGVGRHRTALAILDPDKLVAYQKALMASELIYVAAITLAKLAVLALYRRVFTLKPYRISTYVIGSIIIANWFAALMLSFLMCQPFAYNWDYTIPSGRCIQTTRVYQWITFPSIVTDLMILILPMRVVWKLQLPRSQKTGLVLTFLTGSL